MDKPRLWRLIININISLIFQRISKYKNDEADLIEVQPLTEVTTHQLSTQNITVEARNEH